MRAAALAMSLAAGAAPPAVAQDEPIPAPHPVITEVLYFVPDEATGADPNKDGSRAPTGDEFVELYNPHAEAIDVSGYTVSDFHPETRYRIALTIPSPTVLEPGQSLVIFNGNKQRRSMPRPYGDTRTPAAGPNSAFDGAIVYSIKNLAPSRAWANEHDMVVLESPEGDAIDVVIWGRPAHAPPKGALRITRVENLSPHSFQRRGPWGEMVPHPDLDDRLFSPGETFDPEPAGGESR